MMGRAKRAIGMEAGYNESQRAMVGAKLKSLFEEQAKERQIEAAKKSGNTAFVREYNKNCITETKKVGPNLGRASDSDRSSHEADVTKVEKRFW